MKKLLIFVLIILVLGGGGWYGQEYLKKKFFSEVQPIINPVVENPDLEAPVAESDPLKDQALRIAHKAVVINKVLLEATIRLAKEKIATAVQIIESNYDYDAPWLELGGYRKLIGDYDGAADAWKFLMVIRPQAFVPPHNLGDLYAFTLGDQKQGEQYFLKSLELNAQNIQAYLALATLYKDSTILNKQAQVDDILLRGISKNPGNFNLLVVLGEYYRDVGDKAMALKYFKDALTVNPGNAAVSDEIDRLSR